MDAAWKCGRDQGSGATPHVDARFFFQRANTVFTAEKRLGVVEGQLRVPELAHRAVHHKYGTGDVRVRLVLEPHSAVERNGRKSRATRSTSSSRES